MDFYFNIENDAHRQKSLKALADLKKTLGWKIIMEHYKGVQSNIEDQVFGLTSDIEAKYSATDMLKMQRNMVKEFSEIIDSMLAFCAPDTGVSLTDSLDPYDKSLLNRSSTGNANPESIDGVNL